MKNICVVTGGGSGMGLESARLMGKDHKIILMGRTVSKLDNAVKDLSSQGIEVESYPGDASDRASVRKLAEYAASQGEVRYLIHAAGVAPAMTDGINLFNINAVGTIIIDEEFAEVMPAGSCILNISSSSAYMLPAGMIPTEDFKLSLEDTESFRSRMIEILNTYPEDRRAGMAYPLSKSFVVWYTERMAVKLAPKGIRVISIAPGVIRTPLSLASDTSEVLADNSPAGRMATPEETAAFIEFILRDKYINGTDILYDGGIIAAMHAGQECGPAEQMKK